MELWYPGATSQTLGNDAGSFFTNYAPKGVFHTTEGKTLASAIGAYTSHNSWPTATASYEAGEFLLDQHLPINVAARSLKNPSGGVETNRGNCIQIELVGTSDIANKSWGTQYVENFPHGYLDGIKKFMEWVNEQMGVPLRCNVKFKSYPSSYGPLNGIRLSGSAWTSYSGWLGHQHVPENDHGDPGLLNVTYLLAPPPPLPPGVDVNETVVLLTNDAGQSLLCGLQTPWSMGLNATDRTAYKNAGTKEIRVTQDAITRWQKVRVDDVSNDPV